MSITDSLRYLYNMLLGCHAAKIDSLTWEHPHSPNVNRCIFVRFFISFSLSSNSSENIRPFDETYLFHHSNILIRFWEERIPL